MPRSRSSTYAWYAATWARRAVRSTGRNACARALVLSEKTVKTHVSNILMKLDLADRTQAALWAVRHGVTG